MILKRLLSAIPTLFCVFLLNFLFIQILPYGPLQKIISDLKQEPRYSTFLKPQKAEYHQVDALMEEQLNKDFGFDLPLNQRFFKMLKRYVLLDFGKSYLSDEPVLGLFVKRFPVSFSLAFFSVLFLILIGVPMGMAKAVYDNSLFDKITTIIFGFFHSIPSFVYALIFLMLFSVLWPLFPIKGLVSYDYQALGFFAKIRDFVWHLTLPLLSIVIAHLSRITVLAKNGLSHELKQNYVVGVFAKGASFSYVLWNHCFKNAMLYVFGGLHYIFLSIFFYLEILVEFIFSLDGVGSLTFSATLNHDYPVVLASIYLFTVFIIILQLFWDIAYRILDPRV